MTAATVGPFTRYLLFGVGFLVAVVVSALVAATWFALAGGQADEVFLPVMMLAGFYALTAGAPGFLLTLYLALTLRISSWIYFTVAGGLNAMLALALVGMFFGVAGPSFAGGAAGGLAFWVLARRCGLLARHESVGE